MRPEVFFTQIAFIPFVVLVSVKYLLRPVGRACSPDAFGADRSIHRITDEKLTREYLTQFPDKGKDFIVCVLGTFRTESAQRQL